MISKLAKVWAWTRDGWRFRQIESTAFILGARLDPLGQRGYVGGVQHPAGTWLVWAPGAEYATAVRDEDFAAWRERHP